MKYNKTLDKLKKDIDTIMLIIHDFTDENEAMTDEYRAKKYRWLLEDLKEFADSKGVEQYGYKQEVEEFLEYIKDDYRKLLEDENSEEYDPFFFCLYEDIDDIKEDAVEHDLEDKDGSKVGIIQEAVTGLMNGIEKYVWDSKKQKYNLEKVSKAQKKLLELLREEKEIDTYGDTLKWKYKGVAELKDGSTVQQRSTGHEGYGIGDFKNEFIRDIIHGDYGKKYRKADITSLEVTKVYY